MRFIAPLAIVIGAGVAALVVVVAAAFSEFGRGTFPAWGYFAAGAVFLAGLVLAILVARRGRRRGSS
jgi:hypothetical protein